MTREEAERLLRGSDGKPCLHDYLKRERVGVGVLGERYFCLACGKERKLMDESPAR